MGAYSCRKSKNQPSIKNRRTTLEVAPLELVDFGQEEKVSSHSDSHGQRSKQAESKPSVILNTAQFVSAVGQLWDCATRHISVFHSKANVKYNDSVCWKESKLCCPGGEGNSKTSISADAKYFCIDTISGSFSPLVTNSNFELLNVIQKISLFEPYGGNHSHSFWKYLQVGNSNMLEESWKKKGFASVGSSCALGQIYGWMSEKPCLGLKFPVNVTEVENHKPGEGCIFRVVTVPTDDSCVGSTDFSSKLTKCNDSPPVETVESVEDAKLSFTSLSTEYSLGAGSNSEANGAISRTPSSSLYSDYYIGLCALGNSTFEECHYETDVDDDVLENGKRQLNELVFETEPTTELSSSVQEKPVSAIANQKHAFAGALAGTVVSLCLHPVDTIKTVIQSCGTDQKSVSHVVRSVISERGVIGLYRGIASNIASSAPISAVYTFTYESVKGSLLPILPKEYYSLAHCMAGGCASVATSFIFTPSERIKQQMQVGSHYQNCWDAFVQILKSGGLRSLYAGWGAVLCRNIPHSIIKFYTYEKLKESMLSSAKPNAQPDALQTLVCGGLAGSAAALFTTPFDVVKTRLQTQIPGSLRQYDGVLHALQEIAKHEGLGGLYRGLTPRLVMYISQGALFFASYEFLKRIFALEVQQLHIQTVQSKPTSDVDLKPSPQSFHS
ncbi:adenine nucleotide transporter BT1, chloroplastic/mitochondrial [Telopea speciosissima]|uniref:adenine nucleotide transporter BT1, chloroplastic/mitochondrial n=1 Tax=Telopea speciosissima TaxID=54955 RepID=UPI001CC71591|nr:adenine nucleotide transporter BT1, chloroplastic/mitochondrial [Telopea speciosissima]